MGAAAAPTSPGALTESVRSAASVVGFSSGPAAASRGSTAASKIATAAGQTPPRRAGAGSAAASPSSAARPASAAVAESPAWPGVLVDGAALRPGVVAEGAAPPQVLGSLPRHGMALALAHTGAVIAVDPKESAAKSDRKGRKAAAAAAGTLAVSGPSPRLLPPGIRVVPTLQLLLRAALLQGLHSPLSLGEAGYDPLGPAVRIAQHAAAAGAPLVLSSLRALLYDAIDEEGALPAPAAAAAPSSQSLQRLDLLARLQAVRAHRRLVSPPGVELDEDAGSSEGSTASAKKTALLQVSSDISLPLASGCSPTALALLHALAEAFNQYLASQRLPVEAVFGTQAAAATVPPRAAPSAKSSSQVTWDATTTSEQHAQPSPYLECVIALLARLDLLLDVVATVGRTVEEARLPVLFPGAAGHPRALLHECLGRAGNAARGPGPSVPLVHSRASLRFLHLAGAFLLLSQEDAWREHAQQRQPAGTMTSRKAPPPSPTVHDVAAIVSENIDDAQKLLQACGLSPEQARACISATPSAGALAATTSAGRGTATSSNAVVGAARGTLRGAQPPPALPAPVEASLDDSELDALLAAASDADPLTSIALRRIVDTTAEYCSRLRSASSSQATLPRGQRQAVVRGSSSVIAGAQQPRHAHSGGRLRSLARYFGFINAEDSDEDDDDEEEEEYVPPSTARAAVVKSKAATNVTSSKSAAKSGGAARVAATDPIIAMLRSATVPVLVSFSAVLTRRTSAAGGGFGLSLAEAYPPMEVVSSGTVRPAPVPPGELSRVGLTSADVDSVQSTVSSIQSQQEGWVSAQLLGAAACVDSSEDALLASGVRPQVGDLLTAADGRSLHGRDFSEVIAALGAAPKQCEFALLRVVHVPVLLLLSTIVAVR